MSLTTLEANGLGKKYHRHWVFRGVSFTLHSGERLLLTGPNGSGKSTLMRVLAGHLTPTEGQCHLSRGGNSISPEHFHREIAWTGPYIELFPEFTLRESIHLHFSFRKPLCEQVATELRLENHLDKELRNFSSGMLARLKAGLALFSDSSLLLLDEPTANMDPENAALFFELLHRYQNNRIVIFASNTPEEYGRFDRNLELKTGT